MADPYTDEELAQYRQQTNAFILPALQASHVIAHLFATLDARDAAHKQEIAERDARIAYLEDWLDDYRNY